MRIRLERGHHRAGVIPAARFHAAPDADHLMQEDAPEAIAPALCWFIKDVR